ncbi:hypothetical protein MHA_0891 [Mannheimia haemolytica PHL213]|nr:hypothetical protein MHA_0891 [Mannheimia haemolytica PHL213]
MKHTLPSGHFSSKLCKIPTKSNNRSLMIAGYAI